MKWDEEIESWGFTWIEDDLGERAVMEVNDKEVSIMAFEDDEYEVAYFDVDGELQEQTANGIEELKGIVDAITKGEE